MGASTEFAGTGSRLGGFVPRDGYIVSPGFDWLFILGSPLLAVAGVLGAASLSSAPAVSSTVLVYMALGHHVPTFLRAYGDPDEFSRNRFRLIAIPLLIVPLVYLVYRIDPRLAALIFVWDQYHFVRQQYGFMRIYDAKVKAISPAGARLDLWLCFATFVCIVSHSGFYNNLYAGSFYDLGLTLPSWVGPLVRQGSLAVTIAVALTYGIALQGRMARGEPISGLKLVSFSTAFGVWAFAYAWLSDPFLSYAIASCFHCVQYDAFAWHYNRTRSEALGTSSAGTLFRTVHMRGRLWLYVLSLLAYGTLSELGRGFAPSAILTLNLSTGLLHYYFDSFIWRVRRTNFRRHL